MHPKGPDAGQGDRPGVGVAYPDRGLGALGCLLRTRNEPAPSGRFFLNLGCPTFFPARSPLRESDHARSALPTSTAASSNTCWTTCPRQARPVTTTSTSPLGSTTNRRPAASVFFHALNALMRSNPDHGTFTAPSSASS